MKQVKRYAIIAAGIAALALFAIPRDVWVTLTHRAGFDVRAVYVAGRQHTPREDILSAINIDIGTPLFRASPADLRQAIEGIARVESASVERRLDGTILLHMRERQPHALWQQGGSSHLIDGAGVAFAPAHGEDTSGLITLTGDQASDQAPDMLAALAGVPDIQAATIKAVNHQGRRWDIYLKNGTVLRLPETGMAARLRRFDALDPKRTLLTGDQQIIDLRWEDRLIVQAKSQAKIQEHVQTNAPEKPQSKNTPTPQKTTE